MILPKSKTHFLTLLLLGWTTSATNLNRDEFILQSSTTQTSTTTITHHRPSQPRQQQQQQQQQQKTIPKPRKSQNETYCFPADDIPPSSHTHLHAHLKEHTPVSRIAFSSCIIPNKRSTRKVWKHMRQEFQPDLWIWLGDNAYTDGNDMRYKRYKYNEVREDRYYRKFGPIGEPKIPVTGIWDDHDYGKNGGGFDYPCKSQSQDEFCIHFNIPPTDPRHFNYQGPKHRKQEGIYSSHMFAIPPSFSSSSTHNSSSHHHGGIHVINLDVRYHRHYVDKPRKPSFETSSRERCFYHHGGGNHTDLLSFQQWKWLEFELLEKTSELKIITSAIQVLPPTAFYPDVERYCSYDGRNGTFMASIQQLGEGPEVVSGGSGSTRKDDKLKIREKWSDVPQARARLLKLAQRSINTNKTKVVIFLSGDVHMGDLQAKRMPASSIEEGGPSQTLYEVTASGLGKSRSTNVANPNRIKYRTCDRKGNGNFTKECRFPFEWKGRTYHDCTTKDSRMPWCYYNSKGWGYCLPEANELVPMHHQTVTKRSTCRKNYHQICGFRDLYGGIAVDWEMGYVNMTLFTPKSNLKDGIASNVVVRFEPEWKKRVQNQPYIEEKYSEG